MVIAVHTLTQEQRDVLRAFGSGTDIADIATRLNLERKHVGEILTRLCNLNRSAARELVRAGEITIDTHRTPPRAVTSAAAVTPARPVVVEIPDVDLTAILDTHTTETPATPPPVAPDATTYATARRRGPRTHDTDTPPDTLTGREIGALEAAADGLQVAAIAARLHVSESTVKTHLHNASRKLGAHNGTHAVVLAARAGHINIGLPTSPPTTPPPPAEPTPAEPTPAGQLLAEYTAARCTTCNYLGTPAGHPDRHTTTPVIIRVLAPAGTP